MNIIQCVNCNRILISEESDTHVCKQVISSKLEGFILWVFDGELWYPLNLKNKTFLLNQLEGFNQQPQGNRNKTTENETEP